VPAVASLDIHRFVGSAASVKALLLFDANPLFTLPEAQKLEAALAGVPFIASFSSFLDETAVMADLILPNHHSLERWVDDVPEPGVGFPIRTLGQPVVEPRWDTRDTGDVLIETAKALGGKTAEALPYENYAAAVKESFKSVHALSTGSTSDADFEAFYKKVTQAGGWWAPDGVSAVQPGQKPSPPAKVNFVIPQAPVAARAYAGDPQQFPFALHIYASAAFADGRMAHLPWLQEMPDPMTTVMWGSWVELSPETARKLEVHEGDILTIRSPQGTIELPAYIYPGLRPDVISIPVGQGHTQYGRYASGRGANPLTLASSALDGTSEAVVQAGVRVSIARTGRVEEIIRFGNPETRDHHEEPLHR
jgi:anaerobic selenocysteine-containing dehydrogenase